MFHASAALVCSCLSFCLSNTRIVLVFDGLDEVLGYLQADNDYYYEGGGRKGRADRHGDKWDAVGDLN